MNELGAPKTYKLYVGGAFIRSESGRVMEASGPESTVVRVAAASRKDVRDAVTKARAAQAGWASSTPYLRGQILYRVAEMLDGRRDQFAAEIEASGVDLEDAVAEVDAAVDTWVYWAGWADKLAQVLGSVNPVAGPFLNVSAPEPVGVVGVIAPQASEPLLGLSKLLAPVLCGGNAAIVIGAKSAPLAPLTFGEVLATSDLPAGAANLLVGDTVSLAGVLIDHDDVDAVDISGLDDPTAVESALISSAENLKRIAATHGTRTPHTAAEFLEIKTVWHPARL